MSIRTAIRGVTFRHPFNLRSVGVALAAGEYRVDVETLTVHLHGHPHSQTTNKLHIPAGALGPSFHGAVVLLHKGELEEALQSDQQHER